MLLKSWPPSATRATASVASKTGRTRRANNNITANRDRTIINNTNTAPTAKMLRSATRVNMQSIVTYIILFELSCLVCLVQNQNTIDNDDIDLSASSNSLLLLLATQPQQAFLQTQPEESLVPEARRARRESGTGIGIGTVTGSDRDRESHDYEFGGVIRDNSYDYDEQGRAVRDHLLRCLRQPADCKVDQLAQLMRYSGGCARAIPIPNSNRVICVPYSSLPSSQELLAARDPVAESIDFEELLLGRGQRQVQVQPQRLVALVEGNQAAGQEHVSRNSLVPLFALATGEGAAESSDSGPVAGSRDKFSISRQSTQLEPPRDDDSNNNNNSYQDDAEDEIRTVFVGKCSSSSSGKESSRGEFMNEARELAKACGRAPNQTTQDAKQTRTQAWPAKQRRAEPQSKRKAGARRFHASAAAATTDATVANNGPAEAREAAMSMEQANYRGQASPWSSSISAPQSVLAPVPVPAPAARSSLAVSPVARGTAAAAAAAGSILAAKPSNSRGQGRAGSNFRSRPVILNAPKRQSFEPHRSERRQVDPDGGQRQQSANGSSSSTSLEQQQQQAKQLMASNLQRLTDQQPMMSALDEEGRQVAKDESPLECSMRSYKFTASRSDGNGKKCSGSVTAKICYGGCDTGEIADWLFPHKKSTHKVCMYGQRIRRTVQLDVCNFEGPSSLRNYHYIDAGNCVCQKCASADTTCLGSLTRPYLASLDEPMIVY